jgi:hypothetical protein
MKQIVATPLQKSHYQAGKGIEKIYRPNEIGTGDNISTTA